MSLGAVVSTHEKPVESMLYTFEIGGAVADTFSKQVVISLTPISYQMTTENVNSASIGFVTMTCFPLKVLFLVRLVMLASDPGKPSSRSTQFEKFVEQRSAETGDGIPARNRIPPGVGYILGR